MNYRFFNLALHRKTGRDGLSRLKILFLLISSLSLQNKSKYAKILKFMRSNVGRTKKYRRKQNIGSKTI